MERCLKKRRKKKRFWGTVRVRCPKGNWNRRNDNIQPKYFIYQTCRGQWKDQSEVHYMEGGGGEVIPNPKPMDTTMSVMRFPPHKHIMCRKMKIYFRDVGMVVCTCHAKDRTPLQLLAMMMWWNSHTSRRETRWSLQQTHSSDPVPVPTETQAPPLTSAPTPAYQLQLCLLCNSPSKNPQKSKWK